jgi:hypothetical protein
MNFEKAAILDYGPRIDVRLTPISRSYKPRPSRTQITEDCYSVEGHCFRAGKCDRFWILALLCCL